MELAEQIVVLGHDSFASEHLDEHTRLNVYVGCESLSLLGWDGGVELNERRHDSTGSFKAHGEWGHVQQEQVPHLRGTFASQDRSLDRNFELTALSGLMALQGTLPLKNSWIMDCTLRIAFFPSTL